MQCQQPDEFAAQWQQRVRAARCAPKIKGVTDDEQPKRENR
jgi:hypothetical protein